MNARKVFIFGFAALLISAFSVPVNAQKSSSVIKKGKALYKENCLVCHQAAAIGKAGVAPSLTNPAFLATSSNKFLEGTIRDGREDTGMPPFAHLGSGQPPLMGPV